MGGTPAEAKNNLGFAYERRGDLPRAFDLYREATELDPKSQHARGNLVHAALVLGREVPASAAPPVTEVAVPASPSAVPASPSAVTPPPPAVLRDGHPLVPLPPPAAALSPKDGRP